MKLTIVFILISIISIVAVAQAYVSKSTEETEQRKYKVLKTFDQFEIRKYEPALYSSVQLKSKSYKESAREGFQVLAGYIFGGNEAKEKIAMTSPVVMDLGDSAKMKFMVPHSHNLNNLPRPNNRKIEFQQEGEKIVAAIQFDGWANDKKIEHYQNILKKALASEKISHTNHFVFLGYNPPYELVNRRNEIIVELINFE